MPVPETAVHYVEIVANDVAKMRDTYARAYGYRFEQIAELGNAFVAEMPGGSLLGIRASMHEREKPTVRTYLRVADVERAVKDIEAVGATIALSPMDLGAYGRIAVYLLGGIEQGVWQLP